MQKAWKRQWQGTGAAAGLRLGFKHFDAHPACASTMAAASPLGPAPTTTARRSVAGIRNQCMRMFCASMVETRRLQHLFSYA